MRILAMADIEELGDSSIHDKKCGKCSFRDSCGEDPVNDDCGFDESAPMLVTEAIQDRMKKTREILMGRSFTHDDIVHLLKADTPQEMTALMGCANQITDMVFKKSVFMRGLVEFSNRCEKNCLYCGLRRSNKSLERYTMSIDEIVEATKIIQSMGYGTVVLQSGELTNAPSVGFILKVLSAIRERCGEEMAVALSCGEFTREAYQKFYDAGATRYFMRIESSNPELYEKSHPQNDKHMWGLRKRCLDDLKDIGFQVGSGVLIGLPGQTVDDLADDIIFLVDQGVDMIGNGPYVVHHDTPMGSEWIKTHTKAEQKKVNQDNVDMTLRFNAVCRLMMCDVNMSATTALGALDKNGRDKALLGGCNVMMPSVTPPSVKQKYVIYEGKPGVDDDVEVILHDMTNKVEALGKVVRLGKRYDPPHFYRMRQMEYPFPIEDEEKKEVPEDKQSIVVSGADGVVKLV